MEKEVIIGRSTENILEGEDRGDARLEGVDFSKVSLLAKDVYMQLADIRRKMETAQNAADFAGRIGALRSLVKDSARGNISEDEQKIWKFVDGELQNLAAKITRGTRKKREYEEQTAGI